jgi:hypothetical protein
MQNTGDHAFRIQFHIREDAGHFKGMGQVRFSGKPHLTFVNPGRINISTLDEVQVGIWNVIADLINYIVNPDQGRLLASCIWLLVAGFWLLAVGSRGGLPYFWLPAAGRRSLLSGQ